jgi:hypothetical protein
MRRAKNAFMIVSTIAMLGRAASGSGSYSGGKTMRPVYTVL